MSLRDARARVWAAALPDEKARQGVRESDAADLVDALVEIARHSL